MTGIVQYTKDFSPIRTLAISGVAPGADRQLAYIGHRGNSIMFAAAQQGLTGLELWVIDGGTLYLLKTLVTLTGNDTFQGVMHNRGVIYGIIRDTVAGQTKVRAYDPFTGGQNWTNGTGTADLMGIIYDQKWLYMLNKTAGNIQQRNLEGSTTPLNRAVTFSSTDCKSLTYDGAFFWMTENTGSKRILQCMRIGTSILISKASNLNTLTNAFGIMTDRNYLYVWES